MNADAEHTPTNPGGGDVEQRAVDVFGQALAETRRAYRKVQRDLREADSPQKRTDALSLAATESREIVNALNDHTRILELLTLQQGDTHRNLMAMAQDRRPRNWYMYALRGFGAVSAAAGTTAVIAARPYWGFGLVLAAALALFLADSPLPPTKGSR